MSSPPHELLESFRNRKITRRTLLGALSVGVLSRPAGNAMAAMGSQGARRPAVATTGRTITINAKPDPITIDTTATAVIVCDMQNDFGAEGGLLHLGGIDISPIRSAIAPTARVLTAARGAGISVIYLKMAFRPDFSDAGSEESPNRVRHLLAGAGRIVRSPSGAESRVLIRDTWNTDIVPELAPATSDMVLYKNRFSGFYQTELDATLQRLGIKYLIVTGVTTSVCVESTIRDAMFRDYSCVLLADCTGEPIGRSLPRSNHEASLTLIEQLLGWVSDSTSFSRAMA